MAIPDDSPAKAAPAPPANTTAAPATPAHTTQPPHPHHPLRLVGAVVALVAVVFAIRWFVASLDTESTDDAYVSGHVTFVAPRVPGQVVSVLVDDNNRVRRGDLLVQLDPEPYQDQVNIAQSAVDAARADLVAAQAQARGLEGQTRSLRFSLERSIEDVDNQIALLRFKVASLDSKTAAQTKAQADYDRASTLVKTGAVSTEEFDTRVEALSVAKAEVEEALQGVYQVRVALGLPPQPDNGGALTDVPADLDQTFSSVRQAQASLIQAAAQLGVSDSFNTTPRQMVENFYKRDPQGDIDRIYKNLLLQAPTIKQAQAKLEQAQRNLDQALLNLSYCQVKAEIDGVVTRRDVNPGNNVIAGQSLMAVRSLTEIWVDANFKETQLANLRIGQPVDLEADMYGNHQMFKGRISGFTMGTGSTLALLPAENATGNFVKVVQRLPVRIDLLDYDPDKIPLFIGLSVTPHVRIHAEPSGPDAGMFLQPYMPQPASAANPTTMTTTGPGLMAATAPASPSATEPAQ